jgi:hypothetical protein
LSAPAKQKAPDLVRNQGLAVLVAWGGIEPPTRGFSMPRQDQSNQHDCSAFFYKARIQLGAGSPGLAKSIRLL